MKLKTIIAASLVPLNSLLLFFLIFENKLVIPSWIQVMGRMHPLMVHFPIVLILLYAAWQLFTSRKIKQQAWFNTVAEILFALAALSAVLAALMGLLLSKEGGYDSDAIASHKWAGALTAFTLFILYNFRQWVWRHTIATLISSLIIIALIVTAGAWGGDITHGDNYVFAPVTPEYKKPAVALEDAYLFADVVQPILENKCLGCHNSSKAKGELIMETKAALLKGGKDGKIWDTTSQDLGLMMKRIHLPLDVKEHMPPKGKPQLTEEESAVLYNWIKEGSNFEIKVTELAATDTLFKLASNMLQSAGEEQFDFAAADEKTIEKLNNNNRVIRRLSKESPALVVNFYNKSFYNTKALEELQPLSEQIIELNLDNMPVQDADLAMISNFKNLRKLNFNFTEVTGKTFSQLQSLKELKILSLAGTTVTEKEVASLQSLSKLRHVYVWNTSITDADIKQLQQNKNISWFAGYKGDTVILKLTPPILQNEEQVIAKEPLQLKLKHYINGTEIRYTLDGSEPDSIHSALYKDKVILDSDVTVKAKAFKPGWISSDDITQHFFKTTYQPDSAKLLKPVADKFKASGGKTVIDLDKSDINFANNKWLGVKDNNLELMLYFSKDEPVKSVTLSMLRDINSYIFPPKKVEVWGGKDAAHLKLLGSISPQQPTKDLTAKEVLAIKCSFAQTEIKYIKLVAQPVTLPQWHPGKGTPAWVFTDEVFVN